MLSDGRILRGALVLLTAFQPDDVQEMTRDQEDAGFMRMASSDPSYPHTAEANAAHVRKLLESPKGVPFAAEQNVDNTGNSVTSLTNRATCGLQKSTVPHQFPSAVVGLDAGGPTGSFAQPSSFFVACS
jgi:RimJ/RimL family protein N-acetyltransferase